MKYFCQLYFLILFIFPGLLLAGGFEVPFPSEFREPPFLASRSKWVDSVMNSLTLEEKIAQLFMIAAYSSRDETDAARVEEIIRKYRVGGIIFFQGGPMRQVALTNRFQAASRVPLLIAMDAEWGLHMRLDSTFQYPYQLMLGAAENNNLIYEMGRQIAWQLKRLGVHISFSPDVDVNINPQNPVISMRSFGENPLRVTMKGIAYALGLQSEGILAVGKHFPGHGDTNQDSHFTLPVVNQARERLDSIELFPFRYLIQSGVSGIMTAHLSVPALDSMQFRPASVSPVIIQQLLRKEMGFKGLIFSDALNMKGVAGLYPPGELELRALLAGNDILLMPSDVPLAIASILKAIDDSILTAQDIEERCRRVLMAKKWAGLDNRPVVNTAHLLEDLNLPSFEVLFRKLAKKGLILLQNADSILPLRRLDTLRIAALTIGTRDTCTFQTISALYAPVSPVSWDPSDSAITADSLFKLLRPYNLILVSFSNTDIHPAGNFGLSPAAIWFTDTLVTLKPCIMSFTANPYALSLFRNIQYAKALLLSFDAHPLLQDLSAQAIFGGIQIAGKMPAGIDYRYPVNSGLPAPEPVRFYFTIPEELGIERDSLAIIDSIVADMIRQQAAPGCQILCALNGMVFFHKAYGFHTYDQSRPVLNTDLYDLASVTKISSTLPAVMRLVESGKINLKGRLEDYLTDTRGTNKARLVIQDILAHQAGLEAWIPFYTQTLQPLVPGKSLYSKTWSEEYPFRIEKNFYLFHQMGYKNGIYQYDSTARFSIQVADHLWMNREWKDSIFQQILASPVSPKKSYLYSDLGFILLGKAAESITGEPIDHYVARQFYQPLGAATFTYHPLNRFPKDCIVPTENDIFWRRQIVHGYVHDMAAAMLGGVAGHAGLFGNSLDLAKLMQMYLNGGTYGGIQYFDSSTVKLFTSCVFCKTGNRRGLGFDKPHIVKNGNSGPSCSEASPTSFGHSGFTGTYTWADPENKLLYVFLSNRVYPSMENAKLIDMAVRTRIQSEFYRAVRNRKIPQDK